MHICPYGAMTIFILNKISLLEPKTQNRVRSASIQIMVVKNVRKNYLKLPTASSCTHSYKRFA